MPSVSLSVGMPTIRHETGNPDCFCQYKKFPLILQYSFNLLRFNKLRSFVQTEIKGIVFFVNSQSYFQISPFLLILYSTRLLRFVFAASISFSICLPLPMRIAFLSFASSPVSQPMPRETFLRLSKGHQAERGRNSIRRRRAKIAPPGRE